MLQVIKRNGQIVPFNPQKIQAAIQAAAIAAEGILYDLRLGDIQQLTQIIQEKIEEKHPETIEIYEIQSIVEQALLHYPDFERIAKAYIDYRVARDLKRNSPTNIEVQINKLLNRDESVVHENANKDSRMFSTGRDLTAGSVAKAVGLKQLPEKVKEAHLAGEIHIHDLDFFPYQAMTNCCLVNFKDMLENGFKIGNAQMSTPQSIQVAVSHISSIVAAVGASQYGGQTIDRGDELLAPYALKNYNRHLEEAKRWFEDIDQQANYAKEKTIQDIKDAMESLEYNINSTFTSSSQTPFVSLGFGLGTSWVEREIQKAILETRQNGLGKLKRTAIFPKLLYCVKPGLNLNPEDPNHDILKQALACTAERVYPDYLMVDTLEKLTGSFKAPMGCRSFLQKWTDPKTGQAVHAGRHNLGVQTLNLPRIALDAQDEPEKFWNLFNERLALLHEAAKFRIERIKNASPDSAPVLYKDGALGRLQSEDAVAPLIFNKRATISLGYIGIYETVTVFYGPDWEKNPEAIAFSKQLLQKMKEKADEWSQEEDVHYSVYGTPSESLTDRFNRLNVEKHGLIPNVTDKEYINNSFHLDIRKKWTPFEKLQFESQYLPYTSGGFINYVELPNLRQNPKALLDILTFAYPLVGYLGLNSPIDQCFKCGFKGEFNPTERGFQCPECKNTDPQTCDVVKRTCGYLGNPQLRPMVKGRHQEITHRVKHVN